jgi:hypothetical protein
VEHDGGPDHPAMRGDPALWGDSPAVRLMAARSSVPSGATTSGPNRSTTAAYAGWPGSTTST